MGSQQWCDFFGVWLGYAMDAYGANLRERRAVRPTNLAEHEAILRCVADREPEADRRGVHAHLDGAIRDFLEMTAGSKHAPALAVRYRLRRRQADRQFGRGRRSP
jgi:DNA-binding FadR family transcriptional regulator